MLGRLELGGGQGNVECGRVAAQLHAPPVVVVCEVWMSAHAKTCHYSTVTTPLSILDDLWVVWFAAGPATGRSEINRVEFAHLLVRTDGDRLYTDSFR